MESLVNLSVRYAKHAFTHKYIYVIAESETLYMCFVNDTMNLIQSIAYYDKSRESLRFRPNKKQKALIESVSSKIVPLINLNEFKIECDKLIPNKKNKPTKYNQGETAERLVYEYFNQEWLKDNIDFDIGADITIDNTPYQIKAEYNATYTSLKTLNSKGY